MDGLPTDPFPSFGEEPQRDTTLRWVPPVVGFVIVFSLLILFVFRIFPFHNLPPLGYGTVRPVVDDQSSRIVGSLTSASIKLEGVKTTEEFLTETAFDLDYSGIELLSPGSSQKEPTRSVYQTLEYFTNESPEDVITNFSQQLESSNVAVNKYPNGDGAFTVDFISQIRIDTTLVFLVVYPDPQNESPTQVFVRILVQ